jgi:hypothetical protein
MTALPLLLVARHLAAWLGTTPDIGRHLLLDTTGVGALGYERTLGEPAIHLWNDTSHLAASRRK